MLTCLCFSVSEFSHYIWGLFFCVSPVGTGLMSATETESPRQGAPSFTTCLDTWLIFSQSHVPMYTFEYKANEPRARAEQWHQCLVSKGSNRIGVATEPMSHAHRGGYQQLYWENSTHSRVTLIRFFTSADFGSKGFCLLF